MSKLERQRLARARAKGGERTMRVKTDLADVLEACRDYFEQELQFLNNRRTELPDASGLVARAMFQNGSILTGRHDGDDPLNLGLPFVAIVVEDRRAPY